MLENMQGLGISDISVIHSEQLLELSQGVWVSFFVMAVCRFADL